MNPWDILVGIAIVALVVVAIRLIRKKGGVTSCGCNCDGCQNCSNCAACKMKDKCDKCK